MRILTRIPVFFNREKVKKELGLYKSSHADREALIWIKKAESLVRPQAIYNASYISQRGEMSVEVNGIRFKSRVLSHKLENIERIFPFLLTIGGLLEKEASAAGNLLNQFYLETLGDMALYSAKKHLENLLKRHFRIKKLASLSPGSLEDWPLPEQKTLFALMKGRERSIGVSLNPSMLMIPRKSISGIFFPTEEDFDSCQLCPRKRCPSRQAPFDQSLREAFNLEDE